ncbi:beta strand repeat-containing protein [Aquisediminimonas profunda]|uniref:beta strand repeat-containing protein n=1 Tax=Aquisediminimonas profunda TaxID=1550733 RepID=UPI001C636583|nr:autotransporter outer membrane beta-barrel domain-containing protein [Aquisediminimonas profunda]
MKKQSFANRLLRSTALLPAPLLAFPGVALADCLPNAGGTIVTCQTTDPDGYDGSAVSGLTINVGPGASVDGGSLQAGALSAVNNEGTLNGADIFVGSGSRVSNAANAPGVITGNINFAAAGTNQTNTLENFRGLAPATITGDIFSAGGAFLVTNDGTIAGNLTSVGVTTINNTGSITGTTVSVGGGSTINNLASGPGSIAADIAFGAAGTNQTNTLNNLGASTITGNVSSAGGAFSLTNAGSLTGNISSSGNTTIGNTGSITGDILLGAGNDTITTTGTITGNIDMGAGTNTIGFGSTAALPTGTLTADAAGLNTINLFGSGADTLNIAVTNFDVMNKDGTGSWALSQAVSLADRININAGTLIASDADFIGANTIVNNATLNLTNAASGTYSGSMSGTGVVNVGGGGTGVTTFSGTNTYTGDTTITQGTLQLLGGAAIADTGNVVVTTPGILDVAAAETVGSINGDGSITLSGGNLTVGSGAFSGAISGANGLTKIGTGALVLSGTNTFAGAATVSNGTLELQGGNAIGDATAVIVNATASPATAGNLLVTNAETIGSLSGNGGTVVLAAGLTTGGDNSSTTYAGVISGAGSLTKQGTGTFTLTGANTYSGGTVINAGTLEGNTTSLQGDIVANAAGTLLFTQPANGTYAGAISGAGVVTKAGAGTLTLTGNNSGHSGTTNLNGGTVSIGAATNIGTGTLAFDGGTLNTTGALTLANAVTLGAGGGTVLTGADTTLSGVISGAGALVKTGAANLTLSGANTYTGGTTVSAGTLTGTTTSLQGNIVNNAAVVFDDAGVGTYAGNLTGTGTLTKANTGSVTLSGVNTYSGATTVAGGTLIAAGTGVGDSSAVTVNAGALFQLTGDETVGSIAGAGDVDTGAFTLTAGGNGTSTSHTGTLSGTALTKTGAGNFTLGGTGTLTGGIAANAGTVSIAGAYTSPVTVASAATLNVLTGGALTGDVTGAAGSFTVVNGLVTGNVGNAGRLSGAGTIVGAVTNSGTVAPGNSPGILTIDGSYTQTATGTLAIELTPTAVAGTGYDQVSVIGTPGTAALDGTLALAPAAGLYTAGATYDIVSATGGISGNFATVTGATLSPFLSFTATGIVTTATPAQVYRLTVTRTAYATGLGALANPNRIAVANGFQTLVAGATGDTATLVINADNSTAAQAAVLFDQLSPEAYGAYATALQDQGELFTRQVALHLMQKNADDDGHARIWASGYGQWGNGKNRSYLVGSDQDITGGTIGVDFGAGALTYGLAGGYSEAKVDFLSGTSRGKSKGWQVGGYADYSAGQVSANVQVAYINGNIDATRSISVGGVGRTAVASTDGHLFRAVGTVGYDLGKDGSKIRPFVGVDFSNGRVNSFTETGANAANLNVNRINANRTDVLAGLDVAFKTGSITPYARAAYRYRANNKNGSVTANFVGNAGSAFTVSTEVAGRSEIDVDAGLSAGIGKSASVSVGYQGAFRNDVNRHGVAAQLSFGF